MLIDDIPFGEACVDLVDLRKSAIISGAYDLQTCGCGTPQCAGFWDPIFVRHEGDVIRWEFDGLYHPTPPKDGDTPSEMTVVRYEFDRMQYINEIREKFEWLRIQPNRDSLGPHGFKADVLDEDFPDPAMPQLPFPKGATIVVGYTSEYHQPWVWVDGNTDIYPRQLMPTGFMWSVFGCWSLMWDSEHYDLGQCLYRRDSSDFALKSDVSVTECNHEANQLAQELQRYWGTSAVVTWDRIDEESRFIAVRQKLDHLVSD
jgi:hypothetical protein